MNKKAQELPTAGIILLVLGLIVLVVLVVIFQGQTSKVTTGLASCRTRGGTCKQIPSQCIVNGKFNPYVSADCQTICQPKAMLEGTDCDALSPPRVCCIGS